MYAHQQTSASVIRQWIKTVFRKHQLEDGRCSDTQRDVHTFVSIHSVTDTKELREHVEKAGFRPRPKSAALRKEVYVHHQKAGFRQRPNCAKMLLARHTRKMGIPAQSVVRSPSLSLPRSGNPGSIHRSRSCIRSLSQVCPI
ncbi:uncharacterized protein SPPG_09191 [Spizellomyces punctatus DAOM BR117]|uniref:Uncharacterized protein n=1 Tax=Spizellomyces punctatus (strain DAOM BR117) TaxID=645134 RepID=A0A0L0HF48_SPIPD|nr:uncharacterized protein SPPG_09191 [Spizellomyces punctatus DAOM BR117]KND00066.1 hypothetical protein SPPG_09191 [Spizellomyces punctatus DAOM BR117]|eukprot:XP_016608105.1 hypothetical protein SPPG_09191 [Spizellomyces punctatus DAOM BR117]